jgi:hypothetical protein
MRATTKKKTAAKPAVETAVAPLTRASFDREVARLTPPQSEVYKRARLRDESIALSDLSENWELGKIIREVADDVSTYGSNFVVTLARLLNHDASYLYKRLKFFSVYSFEDLKRLQAMRTAVTGSPLTWTHVQAVLVLNSDSERWGLLEAACANNWTPAELVQQVRQSESATSDRRRGSSGRPASIPPTVDGKLAQMRDTLPIVRKRARGWADNSDGLLAAIKATAPERVRPAWLREIQDSLSQLSQLEEQTAACRSQLADAESYLTELMSNRRGKKSQAVSGDDLFKE